MTPLPETPLIEVLDQALPQTEAGQPRLLVLVGLPGSGKSSLVSHLQTFLPCVAISTDAVRIYAQSQPGYTPHEMEAVYEICYRLILRRLQKGQSVVFDASNSLAARREQLAALAHQANAPVAFCLVQANDAEIYQRLSRRMKGERHPHDLSDADWSVYQWMVDQQEPIARPHLLLDTSVASPAELAQRLYTYWLNHETNTTRCSYL